jgi:hypothetical protein
VAATDHATRAHVNLSDLDLVLRAIEIEGGTRFELLVGRAATGQ